MTTCNSITYKPSYWHSLGSQPLSPLTVGQLVDIAAEKWGEREAVVSLFQGHRHNYKEVREKADKLAAGLSQLGLNPGDRLAIWGPNSSEWYVTRLAAARGGFIAVQIDPGYQAPQLLHSLTKVDVKALVCAESFKSINYYQLIHKLIPELDNYPECGTEINSSQVPSLKTLIIMSDKMYRGAYLFNDVMMSARPEGIKKIRDDMLLIQPDDGCAIQFSSGTTGHAKAVLTSHHSLVNNAISCGKRLLLDKEENRMLLCMQLCHVSGSILGIVGSLIFGSAAVLPAPSFDPKKMTCCIEQERCTVILATPALYVDMIAVANSLNLKFTSPQVAGFGGAPCTSQLTLDIKETFNVSRLCPVYGMTEIGVVTAGTPSDTLEEMSSTVGYVNDHLELKVVDQEGHMVPMGEPGELWVRGYSLLLKYWGDEEKTREFMGSDGWAKTGDQFILQENGYGRVVGRIKDMIIRIGDNIFPKEMEEFFLKHPDIVEAEVFGVPDPRVGEEICAYLRLKNDVTLTEKDIVDYCKDKIPEYRIPRYIRFTTTFPRTAIGKVQKFVLLKQLQRELEHQKVKELNKLHNNEICN